MKHLEEFNSKKYNYKEIPLLATLSEEEFSSIQSDIYLNRYSKGDTIFRTSDPADRMFIVLEGEIKISKIMSDGREQILYIYEAGEFVGGHNIISGDSYLYNAYSLKDTKVITITARKFSKIIRKNNELMIAILAQSYERIRRAELLIDRLSVISTDVRVAKLLINLIKVYGKKVNDGILIKLNVTQEELGSLTGISRETMSRKLNQFEEDGIIEMVSRGKILIKDEQALQNIII